jgi:hypothetical protein
MSFLGGRARDHLSEGVRSEQNTKVFYRGCPCGRLQRGNSRLPPGPNDGTVAQSAAALASFNRTGLATLCVKPSLGLRNPTALKVGYHLRLAPALGFCSQNQEVRMRRLLPAPAVIVLAASLLAQTSPPPGPDARPESSCSVEGRVVSALDGSPLKSAKLTLLPEHGGRKPKLHAATTDRDGRFFSRT